MPLRGKYSEKYDDALIALAAASHRPANVVNLAGEYAIRVDLEYNRYVLATNTPRGLANEPDASGTWLIHIFQASQDDVPHELLTEASDPWLIDAFDSALRNLKADGNKIEADADFGDIDRSEG